jgi:ubiquinone/menaquinone biosynthesis C-methylase UbiE
MVIASRREDLVSKRHDEREDAVDRLRRLWDKQSPRYDREMRFWERTLFGDARAWVCGQASGEVLEIAVGTGRNLPFYPDGIRLVGVDLSPGMLGIARERAKELGREVELDEGDAHALSYPDSSFDTVVCTFSLCNIPDQQRALGEMYRVLRPGGLLLLADHVASTNRIVLALQRLFEKLTLRLNGDYLTRRPLPLVADAGFAIEERQRYKQGIVERLVARKPGS